MEDLQYKCMPEHLCDHLTIKPNVLPLEFVETNPNAHHEDCELSEKIMIYTIHGGDVIYPQYREGLNRWLDDKNKVEEGLILGYATEKDWGCNQVAHRLAEYLGVRGYWRVNIARVLMDFGRFPGITPPGATHLSRYAINYPFSYTLDLQHKRELLETCYDFISSTFETATEGKILKLAIHSYDPFNPGKDTYDTGTLRPETSILYRSLSTDERKRMATQVFDRMYPVELGEFTADRKLAARIMLTLEKAGIPAAQNYPYLIPDGSIEVRTQVWFFFQFLRRAFEATHPVTRGQRAYQIVWNMLLDTNLRSSESESLRSYLHMFRRPPAGMETLFQAAEIAYEHICKYFNSSRANLIHEFRISPHRLSSLGLEVRKDIIWHFHDKFARKPVYGQEGPRWNNIERIAHMVAHAVKTYFAEDRHLHKDDPLQQYHYFRQH